jgi:hypothetical protein
VYDALVAGLPSARRPRVLLGLASAASAAVLACGPGFQAVYEGNSRFEHCYGLEETPQATMREKADCWRDWSDHYTYGQTRDRIQYAIARYVALSQAPNVPTDEALMMAAPGVTPRVSTITAPAPSNAFAPPPKVLDVDGGSGYVGVAPPPSAAGTAATAPAVDPRTTKAVTGVKDAGAAPPPDDRSNARSELPGALCSDRCTTTLAACRETAKADAGDAAKACEPAYKKCMRGCFR